MGGEQKRGRRSPCHVGRRNKVFEPARDKNSDSSVRPRGEIGQRGIGQRLLYQHEMQVERGKRANRRVANNARTGAVNRSGKIQHMKRARTGK